jgi:hypothetical protein
VRQLDGSEKPSERLLLCIRRRSAIHRLIVHSEYHGISLNVDFYYWHFRGYDFVKFNVSAVLYCHPSDDIEL